IMLEDHRPVAYNFAKKFFEYVNGHKPSLAHRIRLFGLIPDDPEACRLRNLIRAILMDAARGAHP
ncbi:MAG: hypothetical protein OER86_11500, partial [Phycisphaerae bacterium]|nr:hypothetical protein [Phycisphaerae bacterium]